MIYFKMLLLASILVTVFGSMFLSVTNSWESNYLVVVIAGAAAIVFTVILLLLQQSYEFDRDFADEEFRSTCGD